MIFCYIIDSIDEVMLQLYTLYSYINFIIKISIGLFNIKNDA